MGGQPKTPIVASIVCDQEESPSRLFDTSSIQNSAIQRPSCVRENKRFKKTNQVLQVPVNQDERETLGPLDSQLLRRHVNDRLLLFLLRSHVGPLLKVVLSRVPRALVRRQQGRLALPGRVLCPRSSTTAPGRVQSRRLRLPSRAHTLRKIRDYIAKND